MKGEAKVIKMNSKLSSWNVFIDICRVYQKDEDDFVSNATMKPFHEVCNRYLRTQVL